MEINKEPISNPSVSEQQQPTTSSVDVSGKCVGVALLLAAAAAYMGSIAMGTAIAFSSPSLPELKQKNSLLQLSSAEGDWFGSSVPLGALIGGLTSGVACDKFGRKNVLVLLSIPFTLGYLLITYSHHVSMLLSGRILTGFSVGLVSLASPLYISEISPPSIRGQFGTMVQLSITFGLMYSYTAGHFLYWTWLSIACCIWPVLMAIMMIFMPETPFWLLKNEYSREALKSLDFLRCSTWKVSEEYQEISNSIGEKTDEGKFSFSMLKKASAYKPLLVSIFIMIFQQTCGINAVIFYSQSIFKHSGSTISPDICSIIVGLTQFSSAFIASLLMDKAGRRILLIASGFGMFISLVLFAIYYYLIDLKGSSFQEHYGWIPLVSLIVYNIFYAIGNGPIPWILVGELFPIQIKSFASGLSTGINWTVAFLVTKEFNNMIDLLGSYGTYLFFAASCLLSCIFVYFFLPETKGRSLEEIEQLFSSDQANNRRNA